MNRSEGQETVEIFSFQRPCVVYSNDDNRVLSGTL